MYTLKEQIEPGKWKLIATFTKREVALRTLSKVRAGGDPLRFRVDSEPEPGEVWEVEQGQDSFKFREWLARFIIRVRRGL